MTTDQVVVYGGNDGTAETYNTVAVDRGSGVGQEQLVQQVGYASTATGTIAAIDDAVSITTTGMASATFALSGTYSPDNGATVYFERTFDGVLWSEVKAVVSVEFSGFASSFTPFGDRTYVAVVPANGAVNVRVRLGDFAMLAGAMDVTAIAQPVDPHVRSVNIVGSTGNIGVSINAVDTIVPVSGTVALTTITAGSPTTIAALDEVVQVTASNGVMIQATGDLVGTLVAEVSLDGSTFVTVADAWLLDIETGTSGPLDATGMWLVNIDGPMVIFKVRCSAYTSGTATVTLSASSV